MSSIKHKNTKPEVKVRKLLWKNGYRGYRIHPKDIIGKPDIIYRGKKVAIFVNGCFWHRCPICNPHKPKSNVEYWENKFNRNVERDKKVKKELESKGWDVLIIWECEINDNIDNVLSKVSQSIAISS